MLTVMICDDHPLFREGVKKILGRFHDIAVEGEAGSGPELLEALAVRRFDVVILDLSLPGQNGLDVLSRLRGIEGAPAVLILSMHPEAEYAVRALKAGAAGYVEKASVPEELITAIRRVASGGKYVSPGLAERLALELDGGRERAPHEDLSDREYQVLCLLALGKSLKEIAHELFLSPPTIGTYRSRVLQKLKLHNTAELIAYAIRHRLLD